MNVRLITKGFFLITRVVIISLCLALPWTGALSPRACFGLDAAEMAAGADQPDVEFNVTEKSSAAEAARESSNLLTITTYSGTNEGHLITFPDGTTMSIDCASGNITTLSHFNSDHCNGNGQQYNPDTVSLGQVIYRDDTYDVTVTVVAANGRVIGGVTGGCSGGDNACSMALWVKYKGFDYLTGGDLPGSVESPLGSKLKEMGVNVDVLKVSHHGTCTNSSSSLSYFNNIKPEYATISGTATSPCEASSCGGTTIPNLINAGVKMIYCIPGYDLSCLGSVPPQVRNGTGNLTITTNGCTYSFSASNFNDGPYKVDEPCYEEQPPHLMITEVGIGAHTFPENHDWVELYLPMDAQSINLRSVYVTDLDYVSPIATSAVTLSPGDVVILHDTFGQSEDDATGVGANGWWDMFHPFSGPGNTWNPHDDRLVISSKNTLTPTQADIIDAVVWSDYDGSMYQYQVDKGNYLINNFHWGDPTVGSGLFTLTNDWSAIGDIDNGYPQRITIVDTNSKGDWQISPTNSEGTPPPEPTPIPTPAPPPPLVKVILNSSNLAAGEMLTVSAVVQPFTGRPFDAYAVIAGKAGTFSIQSGNHLRRGIIPIVQDIPALPKGYSGVLLNMTVPQGVSGDYRVVGGLVDAGGKVRGASSAFAYDVEHLSVK